MMKGETVSLHPVELEDLGQLLEWRNNPDFRRYFREYRELNMRQQEAWFEEKVVKDDTTLMFAIRRNKDNLLLGCCGFVYINWVHRHADLSLYIGWKDSYIDDLGYAEESCKQLIEYGFSELSLNKIWTEIYEFDDKKKELYERLGFNVDGVLRQNYWYQGRWWDSFILSLLGHEWSRTAH